MAHSVDVSTGPGDPASWLSERGWIIESTRSGGVCVRPSVAARGCEIGCLLGLLLPVGLFAAFMYFLFGRLWDGVPEDGIALAFLTLISLLLAGTVGLAVAAIVLQILWLLLVREEWEVDAGRLEIRRRLLGFSWARPFRDGALIIDATYGDTHRPAWHLAVISGGRKHYLIPKRAIFESSREQAEALARLIAQTTGWSVTLAEREVAEASRSAAERHELPAELRAAGFLAGVDERLRLTIRPPVRAQLLCGIVLVALGSGWTALLTDATKSLVRDAAQQPLANVPFLLVMALMLMAGVAMAALGFVIVFGRERWTLDRNLLIVRSRLFGWKSEQQYVDGMLNLERVSRTTEDGTVWSWELQLQDQAGRNLKMLRSDRDDDVPRLVGAVLSLHTGWPLCEGEIR